jgi:hypothetical protein
VVFVPCYDNSVAGKYSAGGAFAYVNWANPSDAILPNNLGQYSTNYLKGRVVSAALYVRNVTPLLNRGGQLISFRTPDSTNAITAITGLNNIAEVMQLKGDGNAFSHDASDGKWKTLHYHKSDPSDYDYQGGSYPQNTAYCMGFLASAPTTSLQTFEYEFVEIIESIGVMDTNAAALYGTTTTTPSIHTQAVEGRIVSHQKKAAYQTLPTLTWVSDAANAVKTTIDESRAAFGAVKGAVSSAMELAAGL